MVGDGNGWSAGPGDSVRWGKFGAAGLFLVASGRVLLQHRADWTHGGGRWALPGGARDSHESPTDAALRETREETSLDTTLVQPLQEIVTAGPYPGDPTRPDLSSGWTYTTVIARADAPLPTQPNEESAELRWVPLDQLESLDLLPSFSDALPSLLATLESADLH